MRAPLFPLAVLVLVAAAAACAPQGAPTDTASAVTETRRSVGKNSGPTSDPGDKAPNAAAWRKNTPPDIRVAVEERKVTTTGSDEAKSEFTFTYKPSPPDVRVTLAAAPATSSFTIAAIAVTWRFQPPDASDEQTLGPTTYQVPPVHVVGGPTGQAGPDVDVIVPIDALALKAWFTDPDPAKRVSSARAMVSFFDDKQRPIYGASSTVALQVPVPVVLE